MTKDFRLGIVGAGAIARSYEQAIMESERACLVAVADTNVDAAKELAGLATNTRVFASHIDLAEAGVCDAVIVTTPPVTHAAISTDLAKYKLHVLCEKPLSIDFASALSMAQAADENGVLLTMASKFRCTPDVIAARAMIANGDIGEPLMLENVFTGVVDMTERWNSNPATSGGGVLIDNGTHSVDIIRFLLGPITEVLAMPHPTIQPVRVEDGVRLLAKTASGAEAMAETSWSIHKDRSAFIEVYGTEGTIEVGWRGSRVRHTRNGDWQPFGTGYDKVASFTNQIDTFVATVGKHNPTIANFDTSLASVAVIEAAYRSFVSKTWESVDQSQLESLSLAAVP